MLSTLAPEPGGVKATPVQALTSAFDDVLGLLFGPFQARRWFKLSLICLFLGGGTPTAAFHWSLGSLPSDPGFQDALGNARQYVAQHLWLVAVATVLGLGLGLTALYLRAIFRFVLVDAILRQQVFLGQAWREVRPLGRSYFFWLLGALLAVGTGLAAGVVVAFPYLRATSGTRSLASSLALGSVLAAEVLFSLLAALVITLTDDLVVPMMYAERRPLAATWRRLWQRLRAESGAFAVYVLLRFAVAVAVGVAVFFFLLPALVGLFSGAIITAALVVLALRIVGIAWTWNALTILMASVALLLLTGLLLVLLSVAGMPGQVLLQDFGLRFIASREPSLRDRWRLQELPSREI